MYGCLVEYTVVVVGVPDVARNNPPQYRSIFVVLPAVTAPSANDLSFEEKKTFLNEYLE